MPKTWLSTSKGAITTERSPPRAGVVGREAHIFDVRLVDQLAAHAARQAVLVNVKPGLFIQFELNEICLPPSPTRGR